MKALRLALLPALASALVGQSTISPSAYARQEGNAVAGEPLGSLQARYMQVHGDLRGRGFPVTALAFRRDGVEHIPTGVARTLDVEVVMAEAELAQLSTAFGTNYKTSPTVVLPRRKIALPAWDLGPSTGKNVVFTFARKWLYSGKRDLLWELRIYGNSLGKRSEMPADAFSPSRITQGAQRMIGRGCLTRAGGGKPMTLLSEVRTDRFSNAMSMRWMVDGGAKNSPGFFLLGFSNPNFPIRYLCGHGKILVIPHFVIPGQSNASGHFETGKGFLSWWPGVQGRQVYAQAFTFDGRQMGLLMATSNGLVTTLPGLAAGPVKVSRVIDTTSPTATKGFLAASTGLVTEFVH